MGKVHHHREQHQEQTKHHRLNQVRKGDNPSGIVGAGVVLQQGVHGHQEYTAKETDQGQRYGKGNRMHHEGNQEHAEGGSDHSQRNKACLDKVPGIAGRKDGTNHQATNGERQIVLDHVHRLGTGHVLEHQRKHLGHGPEHGKGDNGSAQGTLTPAQAEPTAGRSKFHILIGILDFGDQEARHRTKDAHAHQDPGNHHGLRNNLAHGLVPGKTSQVNEIHAYNGKPASRNDTAQGENLQESVGIAQVANAEHFLQHGVLGCTMDRKARGKANAEPERHPGNTAGHEHRHSNNKSRHK